MHICNRRIFNSYDYYDNQNVKFVDELEFNYENAKLVVNQAISECAVYDPTTTKKYNDALLKSGKLIYEYLVLLENETSKSYAVPPPRLILPSKAQTLKKQFWKLTSRASLNNVTYAYKLKNKYTPENILSAKNFLENEIGFPNVHQIIPYYTKPFFPSIGGYIASYPEDLNKPDEKNVVIAFRGTATLVDLYTDSKFLPMTSPLLNEGERVHRGFLTSYEQEYDGFRIKDLAFKVASEIGLGNIKSILISGHSLGCAYSVLLARDIVKNFPELAPLIRLELFASPQIGNETFNNNLYGNNDFARIIKYVGYKDPVPVMNICNLTIPMPCLIEKKGVTNIFYPNEKIRDYYLQYSIYGHFLKQYDDQLANYDDNIQDDPRNAETPNFTKISICEENKKINGLCSNKLFYPNKCSYENLKGW